MKPPIDPLTGKPMREPPMTEQSTQDNTKPL